MSGEQRPALKAARAVRLTEFSASKGKETNPSRKAMKLPIGKARTGIGCAIQIIGFILWLGCGLATCVLIFGIIADATGTWVAVIGFIFLPVLFGLAPLIHWLVTGTFPLLYLILWLAGWGAMLISYLGSRIKGEEE